MSDKKLKKEMYEYAGSKFSDDVSNPKYGSLEKFPEFANVIRRILKVKEDKKKSEIALLAELIPKLKGVKFSSIKEGALKSIINKFGKEAVGTDASSMTFMQRLAVLGMYFNDNPNLVGDKDKTINELLKDLENKKPSIILKMDSLVEASKKDYDTQLLVLANAYLEAEGYNKRLFLITFLKYVFDEAGKWDSKFTTYRTEMQGINTPLFKINSNGLIFSGMKEFHLKLTKGYISNLCDNKGNSDNFLCKDKKEREDFFAYLYNLPVNLNLFLENNLAEIMAELINNMTKNVKKRSCFVYKYYPIFTSDILFFELTKDDSFNRHFLGKADDAIKKVKDGLLKALAKKLGSKDYYTGVLKSETLINDLLKTKENFNFSFDKDKLLCSDDEKLLYDSFEEFSKLLTSYSQGEPNRLPINNFFKGIKENCRTANEMVDFFKTFESIFKSCKTDEEKRNVLSQFWNLATALVNNKVTTYADFQIKLKENVKLNKSSFIEQDKKAKELSKSIENDFALGFERLSGRIIENFKSVKANADVLGITGYNFDYQKEFDEVMKSSGLSDFIKEITKIIAGLKKVNDNLQNITPQLEDEFKDIVTNLNNKETEYKNCKDNFVEGVNTMVGKAVTEFVNKSGASSTKLDLNSLTSVEFFKNIRKSFNESKLIIKDGRVDSDNVKDNKIIEKINSLMKIAGGP